MEKEEYNFDDTMLSEPEEEEFFDTSEKILKLSDRLAEEIILENIEDQLHSDIDTLNGRFNYIMLFREKYSDIDPSDDCYDENYLKESLVRVADVAANGIKEKYGVELGDDLDYVPPAVYLEDMETIYEFLFVRHYENLVNYISAKLKEGRESFLVSYRKLMEDDVHSKDLFVTQSRKKFKNEDDVIIMHFINEIISDIKSRVTSAYTMFNDICRLDFYEEYNNKMYELLLNYGNKIIIHDDTEAANLYMAPLNDSSTYAEIRNAILMDYIEGCELDDK